MSAPHYTALGPLPQPPRPLYKRISIFLTLTVLYFYGRYIVKFAIAIGIWPKCAPPTLRKSYPKYPHLTHDIFYPPSYLPGFSKPPLYIDIHGGGFAMGTPIFDGPFCTSLAASMNCIVISLDYSKTPFVQFPVPTRELVSTVNSILGDISLSYDHARVCIGGHSAGGCLALSVAQSPSLKRKLHGVVSYYPVVDFSAKTSEKLNTRPYSTATEVDGLSRLSETFSGGYIPEGTDMRDPLLSPAFVAKRDDLPEWVCIVGAENDMLCHEAGVFAGTLGGVDISSQWGTQTQLNPNSAKVMSGEGPQKSGFEANGGRTKWILMRGAAHGFTHWQGEMAKAEGLRSVLATKAKAEVEEWLGRGPWHEAMPEAIAVEAKRRASQR